MGFEDLIEMLAGLTETVTEVMEAVGALGSTGRMRCRPQRRLILRRRFQGLDPRVEASSEAAELAQEAVARLEEHYNGRGRA